MNWFRLKTNGCTSCSSGVLGLGDESNTTTATWGLPPRRHLPPRICLARVTRVHQSIGLVAHNPILLGKKIEQGFALVMSERNGPYYKKIELSRMLVLQAGMKEGFSAVTEVVLEIGDKTLFVHRQSQGRQMGVKALVSGRQGHSAIGL